MLASFGSFDGPRDMEMIGKRIVDGVDIRVSEEFFVRAVSRGNAESGRRLLGLRQIAGCDGGDTGVLALLHGRNHFLEPMLAVLRTPQRSLLDMSIDPPFASCKRFVIVSAFPWRVWPPPTVPGTHWLRRRTGQS